MRPSVKHLLRNLKLRRRDKVTPIPAENIPKRHGEPVLLTVDFAGKHQSLPVSMLALTTPMTQEESQKAVSELREKINAVGTLMGAEPPAALLEQLEEMENSDAEQRAVCGDMFYICWN